MATLKQRKLAQNIIKNALSPKPLNKQDLVVSSGYSPATADGHSAQMLNAKGVQKELKSLGFTEENARKVVGELLDSPTVWPRDKLTAARMIFEVEGSFAPSKHLNVNVDVAELQEAIASQLRSFRGLNKQDGNDIV